MLVSSNVSGSPTGPRRSPASAAPAAGPGRDDPTEGRAAGAPPPRRPRPRAAPSPARPPPPWRPWSGARSAPLETRPPLRLWGVAGDQGEEHVDIDGLQQIVLDAQARRLVRHGAVARDDDHGDRGRGPNPAGAQL